MEQITETEVILRKYLFAEALNNSGFLSKFATFQSGVASGDKVNVIPAAGYYDGAKATCKPEWPEGTLGSDQTWALGEVFIGKEFCQDVLEDDMLRYQELYNLSSIDAFRKIVSKVMGESVVNNALALCFLGDTANTHAELKIFDGFVKRLAAIATATPARKTAFASGDTNATLPSKAIEYLRKMEKGATPELRGASDRVWVMTQSVWDGVVDGLLMKGINIESQYEGLIGGISAAKWAGIDVVVIPGLDAAIAGNANCNLYSTPNFALLTTKSNLLVGSNGTVTEGIAKVNIKETDDLTTRVSAIYKLGTMIVDPKLVQFIY